MIPRGNFDWTIEDPVISWLMESNESAMRYLTSRDLLEPPPSRIKLENMRLLIPRQGWAARLLADQRENTWWVRKKTCYTPKFRSTIWRLQVLADLGLSRRVQRVSNAAEFFLDLHLANDGGYSGAVKSRRGHLCTTGNMARSLIRLGYGKDERVQSAIDWLVKEQLADGGWDCFGRPEGTLDGWEAMSAFAEIPRFQRSREVRLAIERGAQFFLKRRLLHEGKRFARWYWLRYPWHYFYDVLVGLDFMTALGYGRDPRLNEALRHLLSKRLPNGRWPIDHTNGNLVLEAPRKPSKIVTFLGLRVIKRILKPSSQPF